MGDRADRLNRRRQDNASDNSDDQPSDAPAGESDSAAEAQPDPDPDPEPEENSEQDADSAGSIKDQYNGIYMFLPEDLGREFNIVAGEADSARRRYSGKQVEKIRHFEPLIISLGLEAFENMDDDELEKRYAEFDP